MYFLNDAIDDMPSSHQILVDDFMHLLFSSALKVFNREGNELTCEPAEVSVGSMHRGWLFTTIQVVFSLGRAYR